MKPLAAVLALLALAAAPMVARAQERPADGPPPDGGGRAGEVPGGRNSYANPSAVIAAELAFARLAREKGQWTAFRETAAPDAVMFADGGAPHGGVEVMVLAQPWLKTRANPAVPLAWQPHHVWSSCDGALVVSSGAWQRGAAQGWFTTVWQRQDKGGYKWVFDHGDVLVQPLAAPDMIAATVADCPAAQRRAGPPPTEARGGRPKRAAKPAKAPPVPFDPTAREGRSPDGTLVWRVTADASGAHAFTAQLRQDGALREIRNERVAAPPRS